MIKRPTILRVSLCDQIRDEEIRRLTQSLRRSLMYREVDVVMAQTLSLIIIYGPHKKVIHDTADDEESYIGSISM